jgi:tripeptidyl-peptidase-1
MRGIASTLLSAAVAAHAVLATPIIRARSPYVVKETHNAPLDWTKGGRTRGDHVIQMQIGLKQGNWAELERHLNEGEYPICYSSSGLETVLVPEIDIKPRTS